MINLKKYLCAFLSDFSVSSFLFRLTASVVLMALLMPVVFFGGAQALFSGSLMSAMEKLPRAIASVSAPASSSEMISLSDSERMLSESGKILATSFLERIVSPAAEIFSKPEIPPGLEAARFPSALEKISNLLSSNAALLFFTPSSKKSSISAPANPAPVSAPTGSVSFNFDNDSKADVARWQRSTGEWRIRNSSDNSTTNQIFGGGNGQAIVPADYDGDGKTDIAYFTAATGTWNIKNSSNGATQTVTGLGQTDDKTAVGDFDGDGKADPTIFRAGLWIIKQSSNGQTVSMSFGTTGDVPVTGNYNGDTKSDIAVYRPSVGDWYVFDPATGGATATHWGIESDIPVPADYDGDGKSDYAVYRPTTGIWYAHKSIENNGTFLSQTWGNYGDQPVPADYDGDNKADFAVWRPTTGVWHITNSSAATNQSIDGYTYLTFGANGDTPLPSAYLKQIGGQVLPYELAKARLSPKNATGETDLYSRNFSWSSGLVNLPGRSGLDAAFGISYNSLVWTKQGNMMVFDADNANVSPGFRFGFSTIEPAYYDALTGKFAYLMVTPSGARVEFRQTTASNIYETGDSSYSQLIVKGDNSPNTPPEDLAIGILTTDGTRMSYQWKAGAFRCTQIKDRNGNFITIDHDSQGLLRTVTDTLGRVITVNYDNQLDPVSITQTWQNSNGEGTNVTHTWAAFTYANSPQINTSFGGMMVSGPQNNTVLKVLDKVTYADGSSTRFEYNSYGQVWRVSNYATDGSTKLNHTSINLNSVSGAQTDCPRFTQTRAYIKDFNTTETETVINNTFQENQSYSVPGNMPDASGTATLIQVWMENHPNQSVSKTYVGSSLWKESIPIVTEDWANEGQSLQRKRWTWTNYTQDDTSLPYIKNPRVTQTKVGDETNIKRTEIDYETVPNTNTVLYGLIREVRVYNADQTNPLKRSVRTYNLANEYVSRRIIGLPASSELLDNDNGLMSKITYQYDQENFDGVDGEGQNIIPIQHDNTNYGASFKLGRGNVTSMSRWDTSDSNNPEKAITVSTKHNTAGSTVSQTDPVGRKIKISYADVFAGSQSGIANTFAYPTRIIDPEENFSQARYRYDTGANTWAKSPAPAGNQNGKETVREFDAFGRLSKQQIVGGAYTRYEYPSAQDYVRTFTTVTDVNNSGAADTPDEVIAETWLDGAGRTWRTRSPLTFNTSGATATWKGQRTEYDLVGRVKREFIPTEIDSSWGPTGYDAGQQWKSISKEYDWKGRVTREIGLDNVDRIFSYDGCGCAGGEVVTMSGEEIETGKRRRQKIYSDILGRQWKTEVLNYDGSIYTTAVNSFNGRDQITLTRQYEGAEGSSVYQEAVNNYDGHGRLQQVHAPQQGDGKFTSYTYYSDDRPHTVTDARGAILTYTYNSRGLVKKIEQAMPSNQPATPAFAPCEDGTQSCLAGESALGTNSPVGYVDSADSTARVVSGWSADKDSPYTPNTVHFYIDGPSGTGSGSGTYIGQTVADKQRPDVNTNANIPGNHGYDFQVPEQYADGKPHLIYAYGIDVAGGNQPTLLINSPKSILLMPLVKVTTFDYDNSGNRIKMTDETGYTTYEYDNLSRIKTENKHLRDEWNISQHDFSIQYGYNLIGQIKSVTDPFGQRIDYGMDKIGKLKEITGTPFTSNDGTGAVSVTDYIDNIEYRAWGAVKSIDYGNSTNMSQSFDSRRRGEEFRVWKDGQSNSIIKKNYQYYNDDKLKFSSDNGDTYLRTEANRFDRSYSYDQMGRLNAARTGGEARNETTTPDRNITPYKHDYDYNVFGNVTSRQTYTWTRADNQTHIWTNNHESTWQYDADGRLKHTPENNYDYDATGAAVAVTLANVRVTYHQSDGQSNPVRRDIYKARPANGYNSLEKTEYLIYSSVLGKILTEVNSNGTKKRTFVYAQNEIIATQNMTGATAQHVAWQNTDASNASYIATLHNGTPIYGGENGQAELDPVGSNVGTSNPLDTQNTSNLVQGPGGGSSWGDPFGSFKCMVNWAEAPCSEAAAHLAAGNGVIYNGPQYTNDGGGWGFFECPVGGACGYYYDYSYDLPDLKDGGQRIYFHGADVDSGPFHFNLNVIPNTQSGPVPPTGGTPTAVDPCAGNKGQLDFSPRPGWGMDDHIFPRHISTTLFLGRSKYVFFPWETTADEYKERVKSLDQYTFEHGKFAVSGNLVIYTYAFFGIEAGNNGYMANQIGIVGTTFPNAGAKTNVNTVVVSAIDCASVLTSYPGLPKQFNASDIPGAMFKHTGWSIMHLSPF
jgi:YD repeat-containing protein